MRSLTDTVRWTPPARNVVCSSAATLLLVLAGCGAPDDADGNFMWDVATSSKASAHLFGTLHTLDFDRDVPAEVKAAFADSTVLYVEVDVSAVDPVEFSARAVAPPGQSLKAQLSPALWAELVSRIGNQDLTEAVIDRLAPWYAQNLYILKHVGGVAANPMDLGFVAEAKNRGMPIRYFETWQFQVGILEATSSVQTLEAALSDPQIGASLYALIAHYRYGLTKQVTAILEASDPSLLASLHERNRAWVEQLGPALRGEREHFFVAVGAGHLLGSEGLPTLLRNGKFDVTHAIGKPSTPATIALPPPAP